MLPVDTFRVDERDPDTLKAVAAAICESGRVFRVGSTEGFLYYDPETHTAWPVDRAGLGPMAVNNRLVQFVGRRGAAVEMAQSGPYTTWLSRLPETNAGLFAAMPRVDEVVRLPCMIHGPKGQLRPAPAGPFGPRLFTGATPPLPVPDLRYPLLRAWLSDVRYLSPLHQGNLIGWTVACLARPSLKEFPFLVIDGTDRVVGKSRVAGAVSAFVNGGREAVPVTFTGDEHEAEKRFGGIVNKPGPVVIWFDNVRPKRGQAGAIRSQFLAAASTYASVAIRKNYGKEPEPIFYPLIIFTANDASVENDLHDRTVRVVLTEAGRYFDPDPPTFGAANYLGLLAEAQALLAELPARPRDFKAQTRFRDFEWVAQEAARALGLGTDFQPDAVDTTDNFVKELVSVVQDLESETALAPTLVEVVGTIMAREDHLPELRGLLRQARTVSDRGGANTLRTFVERKLAARSLHIGGKSVKFVVDKNAAGVYNLSLRPTTPNGVTHDEHA